MLIGLRKAWGQSVLREDPVRVEADASTPGAELLFHHESLDVYQVGLDFMRWFVSLPGGADLSERFCREVDKAATSVVLNVAEGNGRYSDLDHRRFLDIAASSAAKAAAYLDLYERSAVLAQVDTDHGRKMLSRIIAMVSRF